MNKYKTFKFNEYLSFKNAISYFSFLIQEDVSHEEFERLVPYRSPLYISTHIPHEDINIGIGIGNVTILDIYVAPVTLEQKDGYMIKQIDYENLLTLKSKYIPIQANILFYHDDDDDNVLHFSQNIKDNEGNSYTYVQKIEQKPLNIASLIDMENKEQIYFKTNDIVTLSELINNNNYRYIGNTNNDIHIEAENKAGATVGLNILHGNYDSVKNNVSQLEKNEGINHYHLISTLLKLIKEKNPNMTQSKVAEYLEDEYKGIIKAFSKSSLEKDFAKSNRALKNILRKQ